MKGSVVLGSQRNYRLYDIQIRIHTQHGPNKKMAGFCSHTRIVKLSSLLKTIAKLNKLPYMVISISIYLVSMLFSVLTKISQFRCEYYCGKSGCGAVSGTTLFLFWVIMKEFEIIVHKRNKHPNWDSLLGSFSSPLLSTGSMCLLVTHIICFGIIGLQLLIKKLIMPQRLKISVFHGRPYITGK